jgi:WD40 repeat protein
LLLLTGAQVACLALAADSKRQPASPDRKAVRTDRYGDPLPPGAVARCGSTRLRPEGARGISCDFSPDGKLLVTGAADHVRVWDRHTGAEIRTFALGKTERVGDVRFLGEGKAVVVLTGEFAPNALSNLAVFDLAPGKGLRWRREATRFFEGLGFLQGGKVLVTRELPGDREYAGSVVLLDRDTGKLSRRLPAGHSFACSPDGRTVAISSEGGVIRLLDGVTGQLLRTLKGHFTWVRTLAFSPDGRVLASGGAGQVPVQTGITDNKEREKVPEDHTVRLWEVKTGRPLHCLKGHRSALCRLIFSPDGRTLLSLEDAYDLLLWDVKSGKRSLQVPGGELYGPSVVALAPDGKTLLCCEGLSVLGQTMLHEVSLASGRQTRCWRVRGTQLGSLRFAPDGKAVGSCGWWAFNLWDLTTGRDWREQEGHCAPVTELEFAPDGRSLVSRDEDADFRVWSPATGRPVVTRAGRRPLRVHRHVFSADGRTVTVHGADAVVRTWGLPSGFRLREWAVGSMATGRNWAESVFKFRSISIPLALDAVGGQVATVGADGCVHLWGPAGVEVRRLPGSQPEDCSLYFAAGGKLLLSHALDNTIHLWDLSTGKILHCFRGRKKWEGVFVLSADRKLLAWGMGREMRVWDLVKRREVRRWQCPEQLSGAAFDQVAGGLVLVDVRNGTHLLDLATGTVRPLLPAKPLRDPERPIIIRSYSQHDDIVLVPGTGERVLLLEPMDEQLERDSLREAVSCRELAVLPQYALLAVSPDRQLLAIGRDKESPRYRSDGWTAVALVEAATGAEVCRLPAGHRGGVCSVTFSPDGTRFATGGSDGTILVWDWRCLVAPATRDKPAKQPDALWADLRAADAATAYRALATLAADPAAAVPLLKRHLRPVREADAAAVRLLVTQLGDRKFQVRRRAERALTVCADEWAPVLREALNAGPTLEVRRRLEEVLKSPGLKRWSPEMVRRLRAIQALELIGTPEARRLLKEIAGGLPGARLTQEARAAIGRLAPR